MINSLYLFKIFRLFYSYYIILNRNIWKNCYSFLISKLGLKIFFVFFRNVLFIYF